MRNSVQEEIEEEINDTIPKNTIFKELIGWIEILIITAAISIIINSFVIANSRIPSASMEKTIMTEDRIIGFRLSYLFSEPQRGDIVIFHYPDDETQLFVKRVIGLSGDTVSILDGKVYINDSETPLEESYLPEEMTGSYGPFQVPESAYFVMGDNRNHSWDSRYWTNTYVYEDKILAKVIFRYYPNLSFIK